MNSSLPNALDFCEACPIKDAQSSQPGRRVSAIRQGVAKRALRAIDYAAMHARGSEGEWVDLSRAEMQSIGEDAVGDADVASAAASCYVQMMQTGCQAKQGQSYRPQRQETTVPTGDYL